MNNKSSIISIDGPVVKADNMFNSKMHEMVEVGNERLIGEIIQLEEGVAFIQVYEHTSGLKLEEPVYPTGMPLIVELGPGLIGTIFDGIQRPLEVLRTRVGDYIKRGVKVKSLDRHKQWDFSPTVKKGDKVGPGDIIGEVQESEMVLHKIMIPPNISGIIESIVPKGLYQITDEIAQIKNGTDLHSIKMLQTWPIRTPRPYAERLLPNDPLITGQRVIDVFFPIAKGGVGAIPGGFGSGKCVPPDTPIMLETGELVSIEELFLLIKGSKPDLSLNEEIIEVQEGITVYTFDGEKIRPSKVTHVYRGWCDEIIEIKTKSGRIIEVTAPHKLIKFNKQGYFEETRADNLSIGEFIVIPRQIKVKQSYQLIDEYLALEGLRCNDENLNKKTTNILKDLAAKYGGYKQVANLLDIKESTIYNYSIGRYKIPLINMKKIFKLANGDFKLPKFVSGDISSKKLELPTEFNEDFAELLGLLLSDGMLTPKTVLFYNNDEVLLKRYKDLFTKLFKIVPKQGVFNKVKGLAANATILVKLLKDLGMPDKQKSKNVIVPSIVMKSPDSVIAAFIRGYFLGDGTFSKKTLEFNSASEKMIQGLAYLLTRLGILYSISRRERNEFQQFRLIITSIKELEKFINQLKCKDYSYFSKFRKIIDYVENTKSGSSTRDLVPLNKEIFKKLMQVMSKRDFEAYGISIGNYAYQGESLSIDMLAKLLKVTEELNDPILEDLRSLLSVFRDIALDKIVNISIKKGHHVVYDVTIPETHNFIGGKSPSILHNTMTLQQIAKWATADIIIYIGCGERGNEMTDILTSFPKLVDPRTQKPLMERTIMIANTSNMPVSAREASIYTGITIGEYFRDMGYDVAIMADSTSRWAEALREISARLEEIPAEEGYPSYLPTRLSEFYERAGKIIAQGKPERYGTISLMGAVSPPAGDFSEPVTQYTIRNIRVLWELDKKLADSRHYPAINWINSFSEYANYVKEWWHENISPKWATYRDHALEILIKDNQLMQIVKLIGAESLPDDERLVLFIARLIKEGFLRQNAMDEVDTYSTPEKQYKMLEIILELYQKGLEIVARRIPFYKITEMPIIPQLMRMKMEIRNEELEKFTQIKNQMLKQLDELLE
ncbi:MAG: V-type ATP synthase subunit A [Candidatus Helarchaeota archaeon]